MIPPAGADGTLPAGELKASNVVIVNEVAGAGFAHLCGGLNPPPSKKIIGYTSNGFKWV